jgi:pantetheine-phosphate adenylyltransferase
VASTIVRDIIRNGGDASPFLPDVIARSIPGA